MTSLQDLSREFRQQYTKARDLYWQSITTNGSVIIAKGSSLNLIHNGISTVFPKAIPQVYHDLKSISHIPVTVNVLLLNKTFNMNDGAIQRYYDLLNNLAVPGSIPNGQTELADRIIRVSRDFLREELSSGDAVDNDRLTNFCRSVSADLLNLVEAAAMAQLDEMHRIISIWMSEHQIDRHSASLKVLIISARTARQCNLQTTYFERLLGPERSRNIVYIEELFDNEEKAKVIFSTWFFDEQMSVSFFNDIDRMHRDLLMNETVHQRIQNLFSD